MISEDRQGRISTDLQVPIRAIVRRHRFHRFLSRVRRLYPLIYLHILPCYTRGVGPAHIITY